MSSMKSFPPKGSSRYDDMLRNFSRFSALLSTLAPGAILVFLIAFSLPLLKDPALFSTLFSTRWNPEGGEFGLLPMLAGSFALALPATLLGLFFSLALALAAESTPRRGPGRLMHGALGFFTAIPTVVYGFLGVLYLVPLIRNWEGTGYSLLAAVAGLGLLLVPTMSLFFLDTFRSLPGEYRLLNAALGGNRADYLFSVLLPSLRRGVAAGAALGMGRALGDTMIALMLAGNAVRIPERLSDPVRTLTGHIALLFAGEFDSPAFRSVFFSGLLLFGLALALLLLVRAAGDSRA